MEDMTIGLVEQELSRPIVGAVVDDEEAIDPKHAMIFKTIGQALRLVSHDHESGVAPGRRSIARASIG